LPNILTPTAPSLWNSLPPALHQPAPSTEAVKTLALSHNCLLSLLKTLVFKIIPTLNLIVIKHFTGLPQLILTFAANDFVIMDWGCALFAVSEKSWGTHWAL